MSAEIKLRFWSKKENQFIILPRVWVGTDGLFQYEYGEGQDLIIQRYTGLKDSKGKEIYEGDILTGYRSPHFQFVVTFSDGCFVGLLNNKHPYQISSLLVKGKNLKIDGNIFETPQSLP